MGDAMNQTETTDSPTVDYIRKLHRWRMAFFGLVILLAGVVIGGASTLMLVRHRPMGPPPGPEFVSGRMVHDLQRDLDLSPEQAKKIGAIVKEHMQEMDNIRIEARPKIAEQLRRMNEEISAVLTEEQRQIWQQNWRQQFHPFQREMRPGGPRPGEGPGRPRGPQERMRRGPQHFGPPLDPNKPTIQPEHDESGYNGQRWRERQ
jgi:hypothetical protein